MPIWATATLILIFVFFLIGLLLFWMKKRTVKVKRKRMIKRGLDPDIEDNKKFLNEVLPLIDKSKDELVVWLYLLVQKSIDYSTKIKGDNSKINEFISVSMNNLTVLVNSFQFKEVVSYESYKNEIQPIIDELLKTRSTIWINGLNGQLEILTNLYKNIDIDTIDKSILSLVKDFN